VHINLLGCIVRAKNGQMLAVALLESNLYQLDTNVGTGDKISSLTYSDGSPYYLELW
jgi:hypothetical protein